MADVVSSNYYKVKQVYERDIENVKDADRDPYPNDESEFTANQSENLLS
jgi:hypothetical protein